MKGVAGVECCLILAKSVSVYMYTSVVPLAIIATGYCESLMSLIHGSVASSYTEVVANCVLKNRSDQGSLKPLVS